MGSPIVERDRYFVLAALFGLAFVGVVGTLMNMMPLTRVEPFVVQVDKITGHAVATRAAAQAYKPGAAGLIFHHQMGSGPFGTRSQHDRARSGRGL